MDKPKDLIAGDFLPGLADESNLAVALTDGNGRETAAYNNNSICATLNPNGEYSAACSAYCGQAFERSFGKSKAVAYECHAGLQCIAVPLRSPQTQLVAIVGRTFIKPENYRNVTERAITGDWKKYPAAKFFENILISGSRKEIEDVIQGLAREDRHAATINSRAADEDRLAAATPAQIEPPQSQQAPPELYSVPSAEAEPDMSADPESEEPIHLTPTADDPEPTDEVDESRAWRAFFGSLLKTDYRNAAQSILDYIGHRYSLNGLMWLDRRVERFETIAGAGRLKGRRIRLGIKPDDTRLLQALSSNSWLDLIERNAPAEDGSKALVLFPLGVDNDVSSTLGILDVVSKQQRRDIARICASIAPRIEILRLRDEVARRERLNDAVRRIGESVKNIDSDDFWVKLTQTAAEMLEAERASVLVFDPNADDLKLKALVGSQILPEPQGSGGGKITEAVFSAGHPVVVVDIEKTPLPKSASRGYRSASFMSFPITLAGRNLAVMNFSDRVGGAEFDRTSLELFQAMAPQLAVAIDRATLKEKAGEFEQLSVTDSLTGLLNRRYMEARLAEEIKRSNRHGFPMSFMMLDVDHFKSYNDAFGHPAGDIALKLVGHVIRETLRSADVAARMGGEEFAILLPQTTGDEAMAIADRIRHHLEIAEFPNRRVTASIGVASCSADLCISADLVSAADQALYEAKRHGRNRVLSYESINQARTK